jgi:histidine ammonia-lyase
VSPLQLKIEFPPLARSIATLNLFAIEDPYRTALVAGALSVDGAMGSVKPFYHRIHALRGHRGQIDAAATYRVLLDGSSINVSHADCDKVQDPYSLRCQPQVMGACLDQIRHAAMSCQSKRLRHSGQSCDNRCGLNWKFVLAQSAGGSEPAQLKAAPD